jgi:hypothetical protein
MKKILLLLIATSSYASLMGMEEQQLVTLNTGANDAPLSYNTGAPPAYIPNAPSIQQNQSVYIPQTSPAPMQDAEHPGAYPCCEKISGEDDCCRTFVCCIGMPGFTAMGIAADLVSTPCVCYNRIKEPDSSAGRNHYCYYTRQLCADFTGIRAIHIQGLNPVYASYLIRCKIPSWNSTTISDY